MANLLGQDIGLNYKGIITIGSTINQNVSASLQRLTDGDGNNLPIRVSTSSVTIDQILTVSTSSSLGGISVQAGSTTSHNILSVYNAAGTAGWQSRAGDGRITFTGYDYGVESTSSNGTIYLSPGSNGGSVRIPQSRGLIVGVDSLPSARLHVRGDGTNPIFRYEDSAGGQYVTLNSTGTTITMGAAANNQATIVQGSGGIGITAGTANCYRVTLTAIEYIYLSASSGITFPGSSVFNAYGAFTFTTAGGAQHITTGTFNKLLLNEAFNPSSGTGVYNSINISNTINQTGGANGITRGIFINPTLTSAADYRAIGVQAGTTSAHKLIRLANAAGNKVFEVTAAQEIGLFGVSPSAQPTTAIAQASVTPGGGSPILEDDLFAGYTVAQIAQALINLGILKP